MPRHATKTSYGGIVANQRQDSTGRNPDVYRRRMAHLRDLAAQSERWKAILEDKDGSFASNGEWLATAREVFDRTQGKPAQAVDVTSSDGSMTPQTWVFGAKPVEF